KLRPFYSDKDDVFSPDPAHFDGMMAPLSMLRLILRMLKTRFPGALAPLMALVCATLTHPSFAAEGSSDKVFRIGTLPWIGYGQWEVARQRGLFAKNGLAKVEFVTFTEDKDLNAALASGKVDAADLPTHGAMALVSQGVPIKAVMLEDFSLTAD